MDINKFFQSKTFKIILWAIAELIIVLIVFKIGTVVGFRMANFSYKWGENYHRNFGGPPGGFFGNLIDGNFIKPNGVFGQIIKIDGQTLVIKDQENVEKAITVNDNTIIERFRERLKPTDLKVDDNIVVIGEPNNNGQIEAKFVRVIPPSPAIPPPLR